MGHLLAPGVTCSWASLSSSNMQTQEPCLLHDLQMHCVNQRLLALCPDHPTVLTGPHTLGFRSSSVDATCPSVVSNALGPHITEFQKNKIRCMLLKCKPQILKATYFGLAFLKFNAEKAHGRHRCVCCPSVGLGWEHRPTQGSERGRKLCSEGSGHT